MTAAKIISYIIFLPVFGALYTIFFASEKKLETDGGKLSSGNKGTIFKINKSPLHIGMFFSIIELALCASLALKFDILSPKSLQFSQTVPWFGVTKYFVAVDGVSLLFILLTAILIPISILASYNSINKKLKFYVANFLLLEAFIIGCFASFDSVLFYLFFEATLIPMFFVIGIWGGENRVYATIKFFLYTLFGSVLFLAGIIFLGMKFSTTNIIELATLAPSLSLNVQKWLWLGFFVAFAIKVPMFPFHTWLPDAHVQAPTAGSVILAGVLIKLGAYGFLRFSLPMLPDASAYYASFVIALSVFAVIYASVVAFAQEDMKKLIAYSSVAHMGYVTASLFSGNEYGVKAAIFGCISHGIISAALFLCVGVVYDRTHTRHIASYGGVASRMPKYATLTLMLTMASIGLPGSSGFVGEFLSIYAVFVRHPIQATLIASGVFLGAFYMLILYKRVFFGQINNDKVRILEDINNKELFNLTLLTSLCALLGLCPNLVLSLV